MNPLARKSRAFTLTEVIFALMLLTTFCYVAGRLFHANFMLTYHTSEACNETAGLETAIILLRDDAWHASAIAVPDVRHVVFKTSTGQVKWTCGHDELTRSEIGDESSWRVPPGATLRIDGPAVILHLPGKSIAAGDIRLQCEPMMLARIVP